MANVPETSNFDVGIYQLEITDPLEGGNLGILNKASINAANRTRWLYNQIVSLFKFAPKNRGYITGIDININTIGHHYAVSGTILDSVITQSVAFYEVIRITMENNMGNTNYKVHTVIQSLGTIDNDNNILPIVFKPITGTQFDIILEETADGTQKLRIHFDVISLD